MSKSISDKILASMGLERSSDGTIRPIGGKISPRVQKAEEAAENRPKHIDDVQGYDVVDETFDRGFSDAMHCQVTEQEEPVEKKKPRRKVPMSKDDLIKELNTLVKPFDELPIKEKAWIGVDPGKTGGIIALTNNGIEGKWIIPLIGNDIDTGRLYNILSELNKKYNLSLVLEEVHSVFNSSASSNFTFGFVCGVIEALVIANGIKMNKIQPKEWQKEIWQNGDKVWQPKKPEQKNPSLDTKATSLKAAIRLFPTYDFRKSDSVRVKNPSDGLIDASLLAEYGRRKNL